LKDLVAGLSNIKDKANALFNSMFRKKYQSLSTMMSDSVSKWVVCPVREDADLEQLDNHLGVEDGAFSDFRKEAYAKWTGYQKEVPGEKCECEVSCKKGFERYGGGEENVERSCEADLKIVPPVPVCFEKKRFLDEERARCPDVFSTELFKREKGCRSCEPGPGCTCTASCPESTKRVGGGNEREEIPCVAHTTDVEVSIVSSCEEISNRTLCENSTVTIDGAQVPCCFRSGTFSDGKTTCAPQGSQLITSKHRPEVCFQQFAARWDPLPECAMLCDPRDLKRAAHLDVIECDDCIVGQTDCACEVTCEDGFIRHGGGDEGKRNCMDDPSYGSPPICKKAGPGEQDGDEVVPPHCPWPEEHDSYTVDGCEGCYADGEHCECIISCKEQWGDVEAPKREEAQTCNSEERKLIYTKDCTTILDEEECLASGDNTDRAPCCWREDGLTDEVQFGGAKCAPFGWKPMKFAPDQCAQVQKASFSPGPPVCSPLCQLPPSDQLKENHVVPQNCDRCAADKPAEDCKCEMLCEGAYQSYGSTSTSCSVENLVFPITSACACKPGQEAACDSESLTCETLRASHYEEIGKVNGCENCKGGDGHVQGDGLVREGLNEELHATAQAQPGVQCACLLDVVAQVLAAVLERPSLSLLDVVAQDHRFDTNDDVKGFHGQGDGHVRQGLHEELHATVQAWHQVQRACLLVVVARVHAAVHE